MITTHLEVQCLAAEAQMILSVDGRYISRKTGRAGKKDVNETGYDYIGTPATD